MLAQTNWEPCTNQNRPMPTPQEIRPYQGFIDHDCSLIIPQQGLISVGEWLPGYPYILMKMCCIVANKNGATTSCCGFVEVLGSIILVCWLGLLIFFKSFHNHQTQQETRGTSEVWVFQFDRGSKFVRFKSWSPIQEETFWSTIRARRERRQSEGDQNVFKEFAVCPSDVFFFLNCKIHITLKW